MALKRAPEKTELAVVGNFIKQVNDFSIRRWPQGLTVR
jgi:hypothetical protein